MFISLHIAYRDAAASCNNLVDAFGWADAGVEATRLKYQFALSPNLALPSQIVLPVVYGFL
jgi:hypothetical protein